MTEFVIIVVAYLIERALMARQWLVIGFSTIAGAIVAYRLLVGGW